METRPEFTDAERDALTQHEATIERSRDTLLAVGSALRAIHDGELYKLTHPTWSAYMRERWGWTRARGYQLIRAVKLAAVDTTVSTERQARARSRATRLPLESEFDEEEETAKLRGKILPFVNSWPEEKRRLAPRILRAIADELDITSSERCELRRMDAEMDFFPYTAHTVNVALPGKGGDMNVRPGCGGAAVYHDVVGESSGATRDDVREAIQNLLAGKMTALGQRALGIARGRLAGDRSLSRPYLPPHAGCTPGTCDSASHDVVAVASSRTSTD